MNAIHTPMHPQATATTQATPAARPLAGLEGILRRGLGALLGLRERRAAGTDEAARRRARQGYERNRARLEPAGTRFDPHGDDIFARAER